MLLPSPAALVPVLSCSEVRFALGLLCRQRLGGVLTGHVSVDSIYVSLRKPSARLPCVLKKVREPSAVEFYQSNGLGRVLKFLERARESCFVAEATSSCCLAMELNNVLCSGAALRCVSKRSMRV